MRPVHRAFALVALMALGAGGVAIYRARTPTAPAVSSQPTAIPAAPHLEPAPIQPKPKLPALRSPLRAVASKRKPSGDVYGSEIGIPILMFHRLSPQPRSKFSMTPAEFRRVLNALQSAGYCAVSLESYLSDRFNPDCAGQKPFVLTFDDSHPSQVALLPDGRLDPDSALGVLREVWPDATATFFANVKNGGPPFGRDSVKKIALLESLGFEIGNHTVSHARLDHLSKSGVKRAIRGVCAFFGRSRMSFAYPYGVIPATQIPTTLPDCEISAAFGANTGYFEGSRQRGRDGAYPPLLAPLPGSRALSERRWRIPRLNISSLNDLRRDVLNNPNVYTLPATP